MVSYANVCEYYLETNAQYKAMMHDEITCYERTCCCTCPDSRHLAIRLRIQLAADAALRCPVRMRPSTMCASTINKQGSIVARDRVSSLSHTARYELNRDGSGVEL